MLDIPKVVCNDLNRILTINTLGLLIARIMNYSIDFSTWHIRTLRDIGLISVYDQVVVKFHKKFSDPALMGDILKSITLIILPNIYNINQDLINRTITVVIGIIFYHKIVRPYLLSYMKNNGIKFNGAIEELVENLVLLSLNKDTTPISLITQMLGVIIYHMYFTC